MPPPLEWYPYLSPRDKCKATCNAKQNQHYDKQAPNDLLFGITTCGGDGVLCICKYNPLDHPKGQKLLLDEFKNESGGSLDGVEGALLALDIAIECAGAHEQGHATNADCSGKSPGQSPNVPSDHKQKANDAGDTCFDKAKGECANQFQAGSQAASKAFCEKAVDALKQAIHHK